MSVPKTDALPLGYTPMCLSVYVVQSGVVTLGPLHLYVYGATVLAHYVYVMSGLCALAPVSLIALHRDVLVCGMVALGPTVCALCYLLHTRLYTIAGAMSTRLALCCFPHPAVAYRTVPVAGIWPPVRPACDVVSTAPYPVIGT